MSENSRIVNEVLSLFPKIQDIINSTQVKSEEKEGIGNIVTKTDKLIEKYLKENLRQIYTDAEIVAEESEEEIEESKSLKFIIDPLDGTTNYTNAWPHTVSVGIVKDNLLIGGIIYDILEKTVYFGIKNEGVKKCNIDNINNQIKVIKPLYLPSKIKKAVISYDTPYGKEAFEYTQEMYRNLYFEGASLKTVGPISLDVLKTALGKENRKNDYNNATWHLEVRAWDLAAATCILRELGGEIVGKDGKPLSIEVLTSRQSKIAFVACGNKNLLLELSNKLKEAILENK